MRHILVVLHAYQPPYPIQDRAVVLRIIENCYRPIATNLLHYPRVRFVLNMNATLTEILKIEAPDVLDLLSEAAARQQVEFLESGAYHPILPLLSDKEMRVQITKNHEINSGNFHHYDPQGFFPPELAVDQLTIERVAGLGYKYIIIPENSLPIDHEQYIRFAVLPLGAKIYLIPRDKSLSNAISFNQYERKVEELVSDFLVRSEHRLKPTVIAMDMETYGEHHAEYWKFLFDFLSHENVKAILSEEYLQSDRTQAIDSITPSSWSTSNYNLGKGVHFPLWDNPLNPIHTIQQVHFLLLRTLLSTLDIDSFSPVDQKIILSAYHSCQFWWASGDGRWSPTMIMRGFDIQQKALQLVTDSSDILALSTALRNRLSLALQLKL